MKNVLQRSNDKPFKSINVVAFRKKSNNIPNIPVNGFRKSNGDEICKINIISHHKNVN